MTSICSAGRSASAARNRRLPEIPSFSELGYRDMDIALWYGMVAPAGTPKAVIDRLNGELGKILGLPDIRNGFAAQGAEPAGGTPAQFDSFMRQEFVRWGAVVKRAGIRAE